MANQVATRCWIHTNTFADTSPWMARTYHYARDSITSLQLVFGNWFVQTLYGDNAPEAGSGGTLTVEASIEYPEGTFTRVTFGSSNTYVIADGGSVTSDAVNVSIPNGAKFFVRVRRTGSYAATFTDSAYGPHIDVANGDALESTSNNTVMSGTVTDSNSGLYAMWPQAIIATTSVPSVAILGDSRQAGYGDSPSANQGEVGKAIGDSVAYIDLGCASDHAHGFVASHSRRVALANFCTHVVCGYGGGDILLSTYTAAQTEANIQTIRGYFSQPFFQTTLPPITTGAWNLADHSDQTLGSTNSVRVEFNDWVRSGPTGITPIEITDYVESSRDSGYWKHNGYTTDGTHETAFGNSQIVISSSLFATEPQSGDTGAVTIDSGGGTAIGPITFYLANSAGPGSTSRALQQGGTAPSTATTGTGWTVANTVTNAYCNMTSGSKVASASFTSTASPSTFALASCWQSQGTLSGSFAAANWTFSLPFIAVTNGGAQDGAARVRVWRSTNANGSGATEITSAATQLSTITNLATGTQQISSGTIAMPAVTLASEYLFVQVAWIRTGAGSATTSDVVFRVGSSATVVTSTFTPSREYGSGGDAGDVVTDAGTGTATGGSASSGTGGDTAATATDAGTATAPTAGSGGDTGTAATDSGTGAARAGGAGGDTAATTVDSGTAAAPSAATGGDTASVSDAGTATAPSAGTGGDTSAAPIDSGSSGLQASSGSGGDSASASDAGTGAALTAASGGDAASVTTDAGAGQARVSGAGGDSASATTDSGTGSAPIAGGGGDAASASDAGTGSQASLGAGGDVAAATSDSGVSGTPASSGSGGDSASVVDAGTATAPTVGAGGDSAPSTIDTGTGGTQGAQGTGGDSAATTGDAGTGQTIASGSGSDSGSASDAGAGTAGVSGSGGDTPSTVDTGAASMRVSGGGGDVVPVTLDGGVSGTVVSSGQGGDASAPTADIGSGTVVNMVLPPHERTFEATRAARRFESTTRARRYAA
jgi:hypothetical protein